MTKVTSEASFTRPSLDGVFVMQNDSGDELALASANERCLHAAATTRAIVAEGLEGRISVEKDGSLTMRGEDIDSVNWHDKRMLGGFITAEFWRIIPVGKDGAGDTLRHLQLRWPPNSLPGEFTPTRLLDLAEIFEAGAEACRLARMDPLPPPWFEACATALRGAMGGDLVFKAPTPWTTASLQVRYEPDEIPGTYDPEILRLIASRMPPSLQIATPGPRDDHRAVIMPIQIDAGAPGLTAPGTVEMMRAVSMIESMPALREAAFDVRMPRS